MTQLKVGLVLSGGGAKGAYHAGVIKALDELGIQVDAVAGASIGALNGAILASAPSFKDGADRLGEIWQLLQHESPMKMQKGLWRHTPPYLTFLASFGMRVHPYFFAAYVGYQGVKGTIRFVEERFLSTQPVLSYFSAFFELVEEQLRPKPSILDNDPLQQLINRYLDLDSLQQGIPLYVSVYESNGGLLDMAQCIAAMLSLRETKPSRFLHVQSLSQADQKTALMASAALPLLYEAQKINDKSYTDGGQGGWYTVQGNTPITPLIQHGCDIVIVTHLSDGSLWDRHDFPNTQVIEIRPQRSIARDGAADLLAFNPDRITEWMQQGYDDTRHSLERIQTALASRNQLHTAMQNQHDSQQKMLSAVERMKQSLSRLK